MTQHGKIDYNLNMGDEIFSFIVKLFVIVCFWLFVWAYIKPKGQLMRIVRAGLLVITLLVILVIMRIAGH